jgi:phosphoglycerate dehydrogenase-like enzyme
MDGRPIVAVLDVLPARSRDVLNARFAPEFEVVYAEEADPARRVEIARNATVLLVGWSSVDAALIDATRRCKVIHKLGVGIDKIDVRAAERRGIPVLLAAGINADAVAEMTILLMLAVIRRLRWAAEELRAGRFHKEALRVSTLQLMGRTVGLVGAGHVGRAVARRLAGFGTRVIYFDARRLPAEVERDLGVTYAPLDELVAASDIISLHLPSTLETGGMFNADRFARMKRGVFFINTARGALVDEEALVDAVRQGIVRGAGLDVTVEEPLLPTSPLLQLENVLVTPHIAGAVADNYPRVIDHAYRNVMRVLSGAEVPADDIVFWPAVGSR